MSDSHIICGWDMRYHVQRGNEEIVKQDKLVGD